MVQFNYSLQTYSCFTGDNQENGSKMEISKTLLTHIIDSNLCQNANALMRSFSGIKIMKK